MNSWTFIILSCYYIIACTNRTDNKTLSEAKNITINTIDSCFIKKFKAYFIPFYDTLSYNSRINRVSNLDFKFLKNNITEIENIEKNKYLNADGRFNIPNNPNFTIFILSTESINEGLFSEEYFFSISEDNELVDILRLGIDDSNHSFRYKIDNKGQIHLIELQYISSSNKFEKDGSIKIYSEINKKLYNIDKNGKFRLKNVYPKYNDTLTGDRGRIIFNF